MLAELIVYGVTLAVVLVFAFDALRTPCWNGHRSWRWRRSCARCVEMVARRYTATKWVGDPLPNLKVQGGIKQTIEPFKENIYVGGEWGEISPLRRAKRKEPE